MSSFETTSIDAPLSDELRAKALSMSRNWDSHEVNGLDLSVLPKNLRGVPDTPAHGPDLDLAALAEIAQKEFAFKEAQAAQSAVEASSLAAQEAENLIELKKKQHTAKVRAALTIAGTMIGLWATGDHTAAVLVAGGGVALDAIATYRDFHATAGQTARRLFRNAAAAAALLIALNGASGRPAEVKKTESVPAGAPAEVTSAPIEQSTQATYVEADVLGLHNSDSK